MEDLEHIECDFVSACSNKKKKQILHKIWDALTEQARFEILDTSGVVDVMSENLKELADNFSKMTSSKWKQLPSFVKIVLKRSYF